MKHVLVTGAAGFIGSHLVEALVAEGVRVRAFIHYNSNNQRYNLRHVPPAVLENVEIVQGDITDPFSVDAAVAGCDTVFHLAALIGIPYSYVAPASYVATNVSGTLHVLEAARRHGVDRVLHTSTSETYGSAQYVPIDEAHPLVGQSPYSASKIAADKLAESFFLSFETPVTVVRPFNTFGPRQSMRAVIPTIIVQALRRQHVKLGSLTPVRDLTFVKDTASGFVHAARSEAVIGKTVNLGVGKGITIGELAQKITAMIGGDIPVESEDTRVRPDASEVMELISNNAMAAELMNWSPAHTLDDGLAQTIDFIRTALDSFGDADEYVI